MGVIRVNSKYVLIVLALLFLNNCILPSKTTLHVRETEVSKFFPSKRVYIEIGPEVVPLSQRLQSELVKDGFSVTDKREDAGYILFFEYSAKFHTYPWVFHSFNLQMIDSDSGAVIYTVESDRSGSEAVESLITRAVDDMATRLLRDKEKPLLGLLLSRESNSADAEMKANAKQPGQKEIDEDTFMKILKENVDKLSALEGIWSKSDNSYSIGIQKSNKEGKYIGHMLNSIRPDLKRGETKVVFSETAYRSTYSTVYYMENGNRVLTTSYIDNNGKLQIFLKKEGKENVTLIKTFPAADKGRK